MVTALRVAWSRARRGPGVEGWGLALECAVAAIRAMIVEMNTWPPARMQRVCARGIPSSTPRHARFERVDLGGVPCEKTSVQGTSPGRVLYYIHGGGTVLGTPRGHRGIVSRLAVWSRSCAYSPDYRLAPQHPYPAGLDDVYSGYRALLDRGVEPEGLVVGGDSAGGMMTLALMMRLRDEGLPLPAAGIAISPAPDLTFPGESWKDNRSTDFLSREVVEVWAGHYATPEQWRTDPLVSVILGDFEGLPPVLVQAGGLECLHDDILTLVEKMRRAGVDVTFEDYPRMPHVWHLLRAFTPEGDRAIRSAVEFIESRG